MATHNTQSADGTGVSRTRFLLVVIALALAAGVAAAQTYEVLYNFAPLPPSNSYAALVQDSAGNLYGTSTQGGSGEGSGGPGTIFKLETDGTLKILHSFQGDPDGSTPYAALIADGSGNLYGTTSAGPQSNCGGTVFKLDAADTLTTLYAFCPLQPGYNLRGPLVRDDAGNLYGTTTYGGLPPYGYGIVFKVDPSGAKTTLHQFSYVNGGVYPRAGLIRDTAGNLYGTTSGGDEPGGNTNEGGTIFRLDAAGTLTTLHHFTGSDGAFPVADLIRDDSGNLYGTTAYGGSKGFGTVFRLDSLGVLTTLHSFQESDGANPRAALVRDDLGNLYGTTANGGAYGLGTVFELDPLGTLTTLHNFNGSDGANPRAPLIRDASGNLIGTTSSGGAVARGTIFRIDPAGTLTTLHNFNSPEPANPQAGLTLDGSGNLYGMSYAGGLNDVGTAFRLDPAGTLTILHQFDGSTGSRPIGALTFGWDQSLYGTTNTGGASGAGTLFRMDPNGTLTTIINFEDRQTGAYPACTLTPPDEFGNQFGTGGGGANGGAGGTVFMFNPPDSVVKMQDIYYVGADVIRDSDGNLYGTTDRVIYYTGGSIWKLDTSGTLTTLHEFTEFERSNPQSPLLRDSSGNLYGTTTAGGTYGLGTVFRLDASGTLTNLHSFNGSDGSSPNGGLLRDNWGNLYGTTGGFYNSGSIFRINAAGDFSTLHFFGDSPYGLADGVFPQGVLIQDVAGNLYGMTYRGGTGGTGTIFRINVPSGPTVTSFTPAAGPIGVQVIISGSGFTGTSSVKFNDNDAFFNVLSSTQLMARVSGGTTSGKITVTTPLGTTTSTADFIVPPTITGFAPTSGVPGTTVVITGQNFATATAVAFNGVGAPFTINSPTQITATVPPLAWGDGKIRVTNPAGSAPSVIPFLVPPTITSFSPASGPAGTTVIITGTTFNHASSVTINGVAATFTLNTNTQITAKIPSGATTGKIGVTTPGGTGTSATNFGITPTITSFTPTAGPIGAKVTINGTSFTGVSSVKFNGKAASLITLISSTQLTATVSGGTTSGKITVTTAGGTATSATNFVVVVPPTVTGFSPGSGVPGTSIVITGTSFDTASAVAFNGFGATFTINSPTQITATVPASATTGKIKVTNAAGGAYSVASFLVPPQITSFTPASGRVGTSVTINGKTFNNVSSVQFNGVTATFTIYSSTKITATVPSGATTGKIAVTTPGGTTTSATNFTVSP